MVFRGLYVVPGIYPETPHPLYYLSISVNFYLFFSKFFIITTNERNSAIYPYNPFETVLMN